MPHSRRRKFSVQHDISGRNTSKSKSQSEQSSHTETNSTTPQNESLVKINNNKKHKPNISKSNPPILDTIVESTSSATDSLQKITLSKTDRDVTASGSNIDLINLMAESESVLENYDFYVRNVQKEIEKKQVKLNNRDVPRRDKPYQHRVKVRSPKRREVVIPTNTIAKDQVLTDSSDNDSQSIGINAIDWDHELEECVIDNVTQYYIVENEEEVDDARSNHSNEDMCRICHGAEGLSSELGQLISACSCRGTVGRVHVKCLERWLTESGKSRCELCGTRYATLRVHRYGVPRALVMWVLSQNAKQLMVDSLGIMLMSPLAILAAWLSGRTLAGLMTQDTHVTPWPLASTFVLACMTLVCYYCWIVSAATRHALAWWIWYRSQYEVRLQLQNSEE